MNLERSAVGILFLLFALIPSSLYMPFVALLVMLLIGSRGGQVPTRIARWIVPLLLMGMASAGYSVSNQIAYDALKDVWYLAKVILVVVLGYLIGSRTNFDLNWTRATLLIAALATFPNLFSLIKNGSVSFSFRVVTMGAIILVPFYLQFKVFQARDSRLVRWLVVSPFLLTIAVSLSRTTILLFFVSLIGARGVFQSKRKLAIAGVSLAVVVSIVINMLPPYDINNITFLGKISNSINEVSFVTDNSLTEITANWRGFEAALAFLQWKDGSIGQIVFGQGFGALVDIGFYFPLLGDDVPPIRYLPILHNGYAMILVKYGLFGVMMFFAFLSTPLFSNYNPLDPVSVFAKRLGSTAAISLMLSMPIITGPFNLSQMDGVTLLMGWAMGLQAQRLRGGRRTVTIQAL